MECLIEAGAEICEDVLREAGARGSERCVNLILEAGGDASQMLIGAAIEGRSHIVDLLIKAGFDVNTIDRHGIKALFYAVYEGYVQCTDLLLKAGADVNLTDQIRKTVLFSSDKWPRTTIFTIKVLNSVKLILRKGIKVSVRDNHGSNALSDFLIHRLKFDDPHCSTFAMLLLSAGETVDKDRRIELLKLLNENNGIAPVEVPEYLRSSAEISLMNICRETIRKHLLQMSDVNLFCRVPQLPLPQLMTSYLLYDVT